jgi:hypothetical protein
LASLLSSHSAVDFNRHLVYERKSLKGVDEEIGWHMNPSVFTVDGFMLYPLLINVNYFVIAQPRSLVL